MDGEDHIPFKMRPVTGWKGEQVNYLAAPAGLYSYVDLDSWVPAKVQVLWFWVKRLLGRL